VRMPEVKSQKGSADLGAHAAGPRSPRRVVKGEDQMIVTSLSALAASVRSTLNWGRSNSDARQPAAARKKGAMPDTDTAGHSQDRVEFSAGAIELYKIASVQFHHLPPSAKKEHVHKRLASPEVRAATGAIRRYTSGA
jgi:hypothetical protein